MHIPCPKLPFLASEMLMSASAYRRVLGNQNLLPQDVSKIVGDGGYTCARNQKSFKYKGNNSLLLLVSHKFVSSMNKLMTLCSSVE